MTPLATFLAGSLLSLLLPIALLIGLVIWHMSSIKRIPESPPRTPDVTSLQTGSEQVESPAGEEG